MHWGKVVIHCLMLVILFLLAAIFVIPLTDVIENGTMRVVVKELIRIGFTVGVLPTKRGKHTLSKIRHEKSRFFLR